MNKCHRILFAKFSPSPSSGGLSHLCTFRSWSRSENLCLVYVTYFFGTGKFKTALRKQSTHYQASSTYQASIKHISSTKQACSKHAASTQQALSSKHAESMQEACSKHAQSTHLEYGSGSFCTTEI